MAMSTDAERVQQDVINGEFSGQVPVSSGVPQGSVLGAQAVFFLLFIHDISEGITCDMRLFADTIIYRTIRSRIDSDNLQTDLSRLEKWSKDGKMEFHPARCKILHITRSKRPITSNYTIYGQDLEPVDIYCQVFWSPPLHRFAVEQACEGHKTECQRCVKITLEKPPS